MVKLSIGCLCVSAVLIALFAVAGPVGSLPYGINCVRSLGDVATAGTAYPDMGFTCANEPRLVFGSNYQQSDWASWESSVKHYTMYTSSSQHTTWTGVWVSGWGDVNNDTDCDVVVCDTRHNNFKDWDENFGICYVLYNIGEPTTGGQTKLCLNSPGPTKATIVTITADQAQSRLGCCAEIIGDVDNDGYDELLIGESGWGPSPTTATAYRERVSTLLRYQL